MDNVAKRVRELRERTGKSVEDMASLLDMSPMSYFDIEFHDDELEAVPSLRGLRTRVMLSARWP
jgi:DNA-binding XRE family transcriptional regulator